MRFHRPLAAVTAMLVLIGCADATEDLLPEPTEAPGIEARPEADADLTPPPGIDVPADPQASADDQAGGPQASGDQERGPQASGDQEHDPQASGDQAGDARDLRLVSPEGDDAVFTVEVVAAPAVRQQGLMHRTELAPDAGMLFLFPGEHTGGFWMKNTLIPLSIAYASADGEVLAILDMEPCEADPCPTYDPGVPYTAALEVNEGAFDDAGVTTGWHVELDADLPTPTS